MPFICIINLTHGHTRTHPLKHLMELLQGGSDSPGTADAPCIAVEVNVGHSVQSVMTKGADHRGTDRPVLVLLIDGGFIQSGIVSGVNMLPSVRLEPLHRECWKRFSDSNSQGLNSSVCLKSSFIQQCFKRPAHCINWFGYPCLLLYKLG